MSDDYTPSTDDVRETYSITVIDGSVLPERAEEFNRWLAEHDESVRAEERERIARNIEVRMRQHDRAQVGFSAIGDAYADAARIAREGA